MFAENQNLPFQPEQVRQVLGSPAGKKLLQLLTQDGGAALQQAAARLKAGDTAVMIGRSGELEITACELAEKADTIANEVLSRLSCRLERCMS